MFTVQYPVVAMASEVPPREVLKVTSSIDSLSRGNSVLWSITSCALQPLPIIYSPCSSHCQNNNYCISYVAIGYTLLECNERLSCTLLRFMNSDITNCKNGDVLTITLTNQQCGDATVNPCTDDESSTKTIVQYSIADMERAHIVSKCITILIKGHYCLCTFLLNNTYPTFTHAHWCCFCDCRVLFNFQTNYFHWSL